MTTKNNRNNRRSKCHSITHSHAQKVTCAIRFIVFRFLSFCLALFRYVSFRFVSFRYVTFLLRTLEQVRTRSNILTTALKNINQQAKQHTARSYLSKTDSKELFPYSSHFSAVLIEKIKQTMNTRTSHRKTHIINITEQTTRWLPSLSSFHSFHTQSQSIQIGVVGSKS